LWTTFTYGTTLICVVRGSSQPQIFTDVVLGRYTMFINLKLAAFVALVCINHVSMTKTALAISAELAKTCQALTAKAFPPRIVGNPASGSAKGSGLDQRAYYKKCVEKNGKIDDQAK
jgi:hypothetical protein